MAAAFRRLLPIPRTQREAFSPKEDGIVVRDPRRMKRRARTFCLANTQGRIRGIGTAPRGMLVR